MSRSLEVQHILRDGKPYLDRYFLAGWSPMSKAPGPSLFLHHFMASDSDRTVHNHPWQWALSILLCGSYREHRCDREGNGYTRQLHAGDRNLILAEDRHRLELLTPDCWTLFLVSDATQGWHFAPSC